MKLWEKGGKLHPAVEAYTVGEDYLLDMHLVPYDVKASKAHAKMLQSSGYLKEEEMKALLSALDEITALHAEGKFAILPEEEDCHTAIENYLVKKLGDTGKKIHTARSRNDQSMTALRLLFIDRMREIKAHALQEAISAFAGKNRGVPMPGYTHMRRAMPTTVDTLAMAWHDMLGDDMELLECAVDILDKSPLGSAAGFGVPLKTDRALAAREAGFPSVQENPVHCANSRGKYESVVASSMFQCMQTLNKISTDLLLFSMPEFGFFILPDDVCTGSSIMPQKKNPDVLELVRANAHAVHGDLVRINGIILNLPSGYNRDYQLTKGPAFHALKTVLDSLGVMEIIFRGLEADRAKLEAAMSPELYAAEKAYKLVEEGTPFREAYRKVAGEIR